MSASKRKAASAQAPAAPSDGFDTVNLRLDREDVERIDNLVKATGLSFDKIAEDVLRRFSSDPSSQPAMHFNLFADRGFFLGVDCTEHGRQAAAHVDGFLNCIKAQLRGLYYLTDPLVFDQSNGNGLDQYDLRDYVSGIELLVGLSSAMIKTVKP